MTSTALTDILMLSPPNCKVFHASCFCICSFLRLQCPALPFSTWTTPTHFQDSDQRIFLPSLQVISGSGLPPHFGSIFPKPCATLGCHHTFTCPFAPSAMSSLGAGFVVPFFLPFSPDLSSLPLFPFPLLSPPLPSFSFPNIYRPLVML